MNKQSSHNKETSLVCRDKRGFFIDSADMVWYNHVDKSGFVEVFIW